jgi:multisubunit Na+/H+ antiporter MnhC subunit
MDLANYLIKKIEELVAPNDAWAPEKADSGLYEPFLWLGQHLAISIFVCVVVVCALTAWQGAPRLRQMGASTGWALVAVAGMASVPGAVMLLNKALSAAFTTAFDSNTETLFGAIREDLESGADSGNPLAILLIISALVVGLAFASLVFMTRQLGILAFVCMAPLVLASLARGGDTSAVRAWAGRLLGLMFAPFALLLVAPFVHFAEGSLVVDTVLLVAADVLMLRMIFHGVPYIGPRVAGAARALVESRTDHPLARAVVRAGAPTVYEQENIPRGPRVVDTPGRAASQDGGVLLAAYGLKQHQRPGHLTAASMVAKAHHEAPRRAQAAQVRREAWAAASSRMSNPRASRGPTPAPAPNGPAPQPAPPAGPGTAPAPRPSGPTRPNNP